MKKLVIIMALVGLCTESARASMDPGAPADGLSGLINTYKLYDDNPPTGDPGYTTGTTVYGNYSTYTLNLDEIVVNGDVIVLENGTGTDEANWSDVLHFVVPDGSQATLTSYEGSDAADFWAEYTFEHPLSDTVAYIPETGGPYTIYTATNDSGGYITYQIDSVVESAVPEPTTMIAGALLLLPFGAGTLRILRKSRGT